MNKNKISNILRIDKKKQTTKEIKYNSKIQNYQNGKDLTLKSQYEKDIHKFQQKYNNSNLLRIDK